jgi:hypothetical protein
MHAFVGQDATSIVLGVSIGGLTDIMFRRGSEARSKYFIAWPLGGPPSARGGLEPHFRVLFSAIFHGFSLGFSIRMENYGIERKQNCSQL